MSTNILLSISIILLLGFASANLIRKINMPSITAYLLLGILIGPHFGSMVSGDLIRSSGLISSIVLSFIAFSIGQNFSAERFRDIGRTAIWLSLTEGIGAAILVGFSLYFICGVPLFVALSFAAIAPATAPAAIVMVVREFRAKGRFTDTLLAVVALDDSWGLMIFALLMAVSKSMIGAHENMLPTAFSGLVHGLFEIAGALLLGIVLGLLLSYFSRFLKSPKENMIYILGFIMLDAGLSISMGVSVLLSNMAMAAVLVNIDKTSFRFFDVLREIDTPFYVIFFVLAGANLEISLLKTMGLVGLTYIIARMAGKIIAVFFTSIVIDAPREIRNYLGIGLAPQAGVALGMAMIVKNIFPQHGSFIMSTIIASTVLYEIFGPVLTKFAIQAAGEIQ